MLGQKIEGRFSYMALPLYIVQCKSVWEVSGSLASHTLNSLHTTVSEVTPFCLLSVGESLPITLLQVDDEVLQFSCLLSGVLFSNSDWQS